MSADDGYTQGWLGAPDWVLDRIDTGILPDYYYPRDTTGVDEESPAFSSAISKGNELIAGGSYIEAKGQFEEAIGLNPRSYEAWLGRGLALEKSKRIQTALESYQHAITLPDIWESAWAAYAGIGRTSLVLGRYQSAQEAFKEAIGLVKDGISSDQAALPDLYDGLAEAQQKLGDYSGSQGMFADATNPPTSGSAFLN
ncbi:MAG: tetratricopeptide repeat protein [Methanospirillum sp.]|uniref:tetratricopeptide repeat protein n=1 Tax=Methanospirillum sp. TaxID=45200 RepID=UPI00236DFA56|nr:tetratricopeptide repeat protein [Methanospirillum sp.]MDD1729014.1 tetratricopeptide repeat protein [Methanospirillum sp.]